MGILAKALSPASSMSAKKSGLWQELMDRLEECVMPEDVDAFERHVVSLGLSIPVAWHMPLRDIVERKREEIQEEDLTLIMRGKFDF